jgi:C4-dicarboxylate-specific signal transduction histidine kinase
VDLNVVVKNVMQIVGQQLALNNIHVDFNLYPLLPTILANANRLEQVIFNLVSNARGRHRSIARWWIERRGKNHYPENLC